MGFLFCLCILTVYTMYGCYVVWAATCFHENADVGFFGGVKELATCNAWVGFMAGNAAFHFSWVSCLTVCQLYQISWLAVTTNERINMGRYRHFNENKHSKKRSPFDKGCLRNSVDFCGWSWGGWCRPSKEDWFKRYSVDEESEKLFV